MSIPTASGSKFRRLAVTAQDNQTVYALSGSNSIIFTEDGGNAWTNLPGGFSGNVSDIAIDPWNKKKLWITYSGYGTHKVAIHDTTGWTQLNDSLPNIPVNCIVIDSFNGTRYIGTDFGVFYRDTGMNYWELYNAGLPSAEVTDLGINYVTNEIWAATFGRGMWKSPRHLTQSPPPAVVSNIPYAMGVITLAPNPARGQFQIITSNEGMQHQQAEVRFISITGAAAATRTGSFRDGRLTLSTEGIAKGTYMVEVVVKGITTAREKLVILQ